MRHTMKLASTPISSPAYGSLRFWVLMLLNGCLVADMFYQDTRWLLGSLSLARAASNASLCVASLFLASMVFLFAGFGSFRKKFGWVAWLESLILVGGSLFLFALGLLVESQAFNRWITHGQFALHGTPFFLW